MLQIWTGLQLIPFGAFGPFGQTLHCHHAPQGWMHSPLGFCTPMLWTTIFSLRLNSPHVNDTLWCRQCLNCTKGPCVQSWPLEKCSALAWMPLWGECLYTWNSRTKGCSRALHHRTDANWEPANCKGKAPLGWSSPVVCGENDCLICQRSTSAPWAPKGCWCMFFGHAAGHATCREGSSVFPALQSEPFQPPKSKLDISGEINAAFSIPWVQMVHSAQLCAHITLPVRNKPCLLCVKCWTAMPLPLPLSFGRWEPTFMDKQFLLQIVQMAFPPPGMHTRSHCK